MNTMKKNASYKPSDARFSASMHQTEETVRHLAELQYDLFQPGRKLVFVLAGCVMIVLGVTLDLTLAAAGIMVFMGCVCLWFRRAPAQITANRMVAAINGAYPRTELYFREEVVDITDGKKWFSMPYGMIQRIVQDQKYIYLWLTHATCYMVAKASVEPDLDKLQSYLEEKTGLLAEAPPTLFRLNIAALIRRVKNDRARKAREKAQSK